MFTSQIEINNGILLEGTPRLGTKLLMSGGGHCNITHDGSIKDFIDCYGEAGKRVRTCLYKHNNIELVEKLREGGIETVANDEGRIFPESMKARDVLDFYVEETKKNGWEIWLECKVSSLVYDAENGKYVIGLDNGNSFEARRVVIATGGATYRNTGSDGSMLEILKGLGIEVTNLESVLAPLTLEGYPFTELAGITLPKVRIETGTTKKTRHVTEGPMLLAHKEITGPTVLNISRYTASGAEITINYIPDFENPFDALVGAVASSNADYETIVQRTFSLPKRFAKLVVDRAKSERKATAARDGVSLKNICELLTADRYVVASRGDNGMVTKGGAALSEISTKTMEAKAFPGLYIIGEALDVDGITGGYNLQFAYSSASSAADSVRISTSDFFSSAN